MKPGSLTIGSVNHRDRVAAVLSAIPGLGHLYKGHYLEGMLMLLLDALLLLLAHAALAVLQVLANLLGMIGFQQPAWGAVLVNPALLALAVLLPLAYLLASMVDAFGESDLGVPQGQLLGKSPRQHRRMVGC
jgi:hypothetical protein